MKCVLLVTTLFYSSISFAQSDDLILVFGGFSAPIGDFHSSEGGGAKLGPDYGFILQHRFKKENPIALAFKFRSQLFKLSEDAMNLVAQGRLTSVTQWKATSFLVGPLWVLFFDKNVFFEPRLMVGYLHGISPQVNSFGRGPVDSSSSGSLVGLAGCDLRFDIKERLSLVGSMDFAFAQPSFDLTSRGIPMPNGNIGQPMHTFNFEIGLGYRLNVFHRKNL
jgi:hypothetical protein